MPGRSLRLGGLILLGLLLAGPVCIMRGTGRDRIIIRWWMRQLAHTLGLRIRVRGKSPRETSLWCCNHVSWLDIVALGAVGEFVFVSKSEISGWPLVGWLAKAAGTVFLKRGAGHSNAVSRTLEAFLQQGRSVVIFPEGTTTEGLSVKPMYPRLFSAAVATATPVQPVALRFSERGAHSSLAPFIGDDTFLAHLVRLLRHREGLDVDLRLLPLINPEGLDRRSLAHASRTIIQSGLNELFDCRFPMMGNARIASSQSHSTEYENNLVSRTG